MILRKFMRSGILFFVAVILLLPALGEANVSLKNGNFFMAYTDIVYPGGFDPKIERVYNSKTSFKGIFGFGWGTEYEVKLTVSADGSIVVHEYGGGAENRFTAAFNAQELDKAVEMISDAARKSGSIGSAGQLEEYKKKLKTNANYRNEQWQEFVERKKLERRVLPNGAQLHSVRYTYQYITKVAGGYVRTFDSGKIEKFNDAGKLVRISDKNNNFIELSYGKDGHLQKLVDNFNRKIFFVFNNQGLLEKLTGEGGKMATYGYNQIGQLTRSQDVDGNVYTYKYDKRHNMIEIGYQDKTTLAMTYYGPERHDNIKSVKDRDGTITEYGYDTDKSDPNHYSVSVKIKAPDGKQISKNSYEYFIKRKADGEEWTYKMITELDGDRTETVYNDASLPVSIKHGAEETTFEYDNKGHVTKKVTAGEVTELSYDPKVSKVSKVVQYPKGNKKEATWSAFQYDEKGNLVFAKNSKNRGVKLLYDSNGRIKTLIDQNKRQINFKYNENSKPVEISDPALGTITVSYKNTGEINKVESKAGRKIALEVTAAFQNLLEIIRPAGVNLSF